MWPLVVTLEKFPEVLLSADFTRERNAKCSTPFSASGPTPEFYMLPEIRDEGARNLVARNFQLTIQTCTSNLQAGNFVQDRRYCSPISWRAEYKAINSPVDSDPWEWFRGFICNDFPSPSNRMLPPLPLFAVTLFDKAISPPDASFIFPLIHLPWILRRSLTIPSAPFPRPPPTNFLRQIVSSESRFVFFPARFMPRDVP